MKFVDTVTLDIHSGSGGAGCVSFRREKYTPKGGPDGGNGGDGGSVVFRASLSVQTLMDLKLKRRYKAQSGEQGTGKRQSGKDGNNAVLIVPCGTIIYSEFNEKLCDLCKEGDEYVAAVGGKGGKGNSLFATSVNRAPRYAQPGLPGEDKTVHLELQLLADVGFVGLPNAGKSTLLQTLTNASPKIANYPFTTLYPNLGVLKFVDREIVLADIPGLVEGASEGVGLGHDFLRHVSRTACLLHLVSVESLDIEKCLNDYKVICDELKAGDLALSEKPMIVVLNKVDIIPKEDLAVMVEAFSEAGITVHCISAVSREGIGELISLIQSTIDTTND